MNKKFYCVWGEDEQILALTTDYGIALDILANHMTNMGRLTDDEWAESNAIIEDFTEFPVTRKDIMDLLSDEEYIAWNGGNTVLM